MKVQGFLIMEPGMDRPLFCHNPPVDYEKKPGAKIYRFELDVPEFFKVDGCLQAVATPTAR